MGNCCSKKEPPPGPHHRYHASRRKSPKLLKQKLYADPRIIILGAGVAGLACAVELKRKGFENVRILEMSDRIGGRVRSMRFADNYIDLGAQWVYGCVGNKVYDMVKHLNVLEKSPELVHHVEWIRSDGRKMPQPLVRKLAKVLRSIFHSCRTEITESHEGTFGEYIVEKYAAALSRPEMEHVDRGIAAAFLRTYKKMEGEPVDSDMSAAGYGTFRPCHGEGLLNWRDTGFKQFLHLLVDGDEMNEYGILEGCIELNKRGTKINWDRADGSVQITCESSEIYVADHVIVTLPLGVLKKSPMLFEPLLPHAKRKAISCTGFAHICKIFIEFEEPFWTTAWTGFNAVWNPDDLNQPQLEWVADIYAFYPYAHQPRVLIAWATGPYTELIETINTKLLTMGVMYMLRRFLPRLKIPQPKHLVSSKWTIDPAHMGAYSYPSLLATGSKTGTDQLAQPVNLLAVEPTSQDNGSKPSMSPMSPMSVRPIILFAGEATSADHYSTVHGAMETGLREANRLRGYYQRDL